MRDGNRHRVYELELGQYAHILEAQAYKCAICARPNLTKGRRLHVDHNHATGRVRGLLCSNCNSGLGLFRDDPAILKSAIDYLARNLTGSELSPNNE